MPTATIRTPKFKICLLVSAGFGNSDASVFSRLLRKSYRTPAVFPFCDQFNAVVRSIDSPIAMAQYQCSISNAITNTIFCITMSAVGFWVPAHADAVDGFSHPSFFGQNWTVTSLFTDNMVLQRQIHGPKGTRIPQTSIRGTAEAGTQVTLSRIPDWLSKNPLSTTADASGNWEIQVESFDPQPNDAGNSFQLILNVHGGVPASKSVLNVSYGDVILCSGQSNMALNLHPIYDNDTIIAEAVHPEIRLFYVAAQGSATPETHVPSAWVQTTPQTIVQFSAICYLTALELQRLRYPTGERPVLGLIGSAVGSTDIQSWMSPAMLERARTSCWAPSGESPPAALPPSESHNPVGGTNASLLYNAMIHPLLTYSISAILWDQGENNAHYCSALQYNCLFSTMLTAWRVAFGSSGADIPIVYAQLGSYDARGNVSTIRFAQAITLPANQGWFTNISGRIPVANAGVAPTFDLLSPDPEGIRFPWIHCRNKTAVGRRFALQLVKLQRGLASDAVWEGPHVVQANVTMSPDHMPQVHIDFSQSALRIGQSYGSRVGCTSSTSPFEVANHRGVWLPATAAVRTMASASRVVVTPLSPVAGPWVAAVRYNVKDIVDCVLYNAHGLPALPFQVPLPWNAPY
eukprot:m.128265 g.128265  ORF g.128265 m.128265 type:complete len:632 (+) comp17425_c0_seq2:22-1917(+)